MITREIVWLHTLLQELGIVLTVNTMLYYDNEAARDITANLIFHEYTKYIEINCHIVKKSQKGQLKLHVISTNDQYAVSLLKH